MKILWIALCALLMSSESAHAFCRRSACNGKPAKVCVPEAPDDCGAPARWTEKPIAYDVAAPVPGGIDYAAAIARGFARWAGADCGDGRHPSLAIVPHVVATPENTPSRGHVLVGDQPDDPREGSLALTQLRFSPKSGIVSSARTTFYATQLAHYGEGAAIDSIALHEAGHFLGLAHSADASAVMTAAVHDGSQQRQALAPDDVAAVCAMFPPPGGPPSTGASTGMSPALIGGLIAALVVLIGVTGLWWLRRKR